MYNPVLYHTLMQRSGTIVAGGRSPCQLPYWKCKVTVKVVGRTYTPMKPCGSATYNAKLPLRVN